MKTRKYTRTIKGKDHQVFITEDLFQVMKESDPYVYDKKGSSREWYNFFISNKYVTVDRPRP